MKTQYTKIFILLLLLVGVFLQPALAKDDEIRICGIIESIDSTQVTLDGISYPLSSNTEYEDENSNTIPERPYRTERTP